MENCNKIKDGLLVIHTSSIILEHPTYKKIIGDTTKYKKQICKRTAFYGLCKKPVIYAARNEQGADEIDREIFSDNSINFISPSGKRILGNREMLDNDAQIAKIILLIKQLVARQILPENPVIEAIGIWKKACYKYITATLKNEGINIYKNQALCR